jgi:hypothetical protein
VHRVHSRQKSYIASALTQFRSLLLLGAYASFVSSSWHGSCAVRRRFPRFCHGCASVHIRVYCSSKVAGGGRAAMYFTPQSEASAGTAARAARWLGWRERWSPYYREGDRCGPAPDLAYHWTAPASGRRPPSTGIRSLILVLAPGIHGRSSTRRSRAPTPRRPCPST